MVETVLLTAYSRQHFIASLCGHVTVPSYHATSAIRTISGLVSGDLLVVLLPDHFPCLSGKELPLKVNLEMMG